MDGEGLEVMAMVTRQSRHSGNRIAGALSFQPPPPNSQTREVVGVYGVRCFTKIFGLNSRAPEQNLTETLPTVLVLSKLPSRRKVQTDIQGFISTLPSGSRAKRPVPTKVDDESILRVSVIIRTFLPVLQATESLISACCAQNQIVLADNDDFEGWLNFEQCSIYSHTGDDSSTQVIQSFNFELRNGHSSVQITMCQRDKSMNEKEKAKQSLLGFP
ncbi:hypothetical protein R3P38DRAFT_2792307 [Favolaschia claudopus]|uniref:Uncharacterized protein n=1 Tax=Favolaschia claudopus TaxID=2862362 RepID=A0AAW0AES9_9AGAR